MAFCLGTVATEDSLIDSLLNLIVLTVVTWESGGMVDVLRFGGRRGGLHVYF
jgi:hypothetical protein